MSTAPQRFSFAFERRYAISAALFGVRPATCWIEIADGRLRVRFGPWRVDTPLANISAVAVTGPYAFVKTAGPARLGLTDRGLTFATNGRAGVCLEFVEPIRGIDPPGIIRHANLTLTATECTALANSLEAAQL